MPTHGPAGVEADAVFWAPRRQENREVGESDKELLSDARVPP